jgi:hypothetical protein
MYVHAYMSLYMLVSLCVHESVRVNALTHHVYLEIDLVSLCVHEFVYVNALTHRVFGDYISVCVCLHVCVN